MNIKIYKITDKYEDLIEVEYWCDNHPTFFSVPKNTSDKDIIEKVKNRFSKIQRKKLNIELLLHPSCKKDHYK